MKTRPGKILTGLLCAALWLICSPTLSTAADPVLSLGISVVAGRVQLTVTGATNGACQVQFAESLSGAGQWRHLGYGVTSGASAAVLDPTPPRAVRYYRAIWVPTTNTVWIPPGTFLMGSPSNEVDRYYFEGPQTAVTFSQGFWMGTHEVTQGEFLEVMGFNPSYFTGDTNRPVDLVWWADAVAYCAALTQRERGLGRIWTNTTYRLPTEAEWEYACRAGTSTRFSFGDDLAYSSLSNYAWYAFIGSGAVTHPVGTKLPNLWGLYDMYGNIMEWCQDWWADQLPGGAVVDPQGPQTGTDRVLRGGSWGNSGRECRSAWRSHSYFSASSTASGFRVVLSRDPTVYYVR